MSNPILKENLRSDFIEHLRHMSIYWSKQDCSDIDKCEGLLHSVLAVFDGCTNLPAFDLVARPHSDDKQYNIENGDDYIEDGMVINDDVMLKELLFRIRDNDH